MIDLLGKDSDSFFGALELDSVKALTVDYNKVDKPIFVEDSDLDLTKIEEVDNGYYYEGKIGQNIYHHAGVIYSQDASAMLPVLALDIESNDIVLDMCAAPGGKSIQILEKLNGSGLLISNEYVFNRAKILYENLTRFGYDNYVITNNIPSDFVKKVECFDKILVDAPCSGEGMFRKDDIDTYYWSENNVDTCAVRQLEILDSASKLLKRGGIMVYSTCTYNEQENERVVVEFLKKHQDYVICDLDECLKKATTSGVIVDEKFDTTKCARRYPHIHKGEGQFFVKLRRVGDGEIDYSEDIIIDKYYEIGRKDRQLIEKQLKNIVNIAKMRLYRKGDNVYIAPNVNFDYSGLNVVTMGVCMGTLDKGVIKLNHTFYKAYYQQFVNIVDLNKEQAKLYLTGNVVDNINADINGIVAVTYNNLPLGGGKIVGGVLKNYYPKELRNK